MTTWAGLGVVAVAAAVLSFAALHDLALACGIAATALGVPLAALLPVTVDAAALVGTRLWLTLPAVHPARSTARVVALAALAFSVVGNGAQHGMAAFDVTPPWWAVVLVSAVPPVALASVAHLAALVGRSVPEQPVRCVVSDEQSDTQGMTETVDERGLSRRWADTPLVRTADGPDDLDGPAPTQNIEQRRTAELIASGMGRRRLATALGIPESRARILLAAHRAAGGGDRG